MTRVSYKPWKLALGALLLLAATFLQNAYSQAAPAPSRLRINVFVESSNEADNNIIRTTLKRWATTLTPGESYKLTAKVESNRSRWMDSLDSKSFDLWGLYSYQYVELEDLSLLRPALVTTAENGPMSTFLLISRRTDKISSVEDLRDKKIVVDTGGFGKLPLIWLFTKLARVAPLSEVPTYAKISHVQTPARALLPVYFGKADACIITRSAFTKETTLNPDLVGKLAEVHKSQPLLVSLFAFHQDFPIVAAGKFATEATRPTNEAANLNLLGHVRRSGLAEYDTSSLDSMRALYSEYKKLNTPAAAEADPEAAENQPEVQP